MLGKNSVATNWKWFFSELFKLFTSPLAFAASGLDAARGWRYSRQWWRFFISIPACLFLSLIYLVYGFSYFERTDTKIQRYGVKSEMVCSTQLLEEVAYGKIDFLGLNSRSATEDLNPEKDELPPVENGGKKLTELQIRYIRLLNDRILQIQPTDGSAHYRLGLLKAITGDREGALDEMRALANNEANPFPAANSWVATELLDRWLKMPTSAIYSELVANLKLASAWPGVKPQVLEFYANLLFSKNMTADGIGIAQQAAKKNRAYHLLLMQYYKKVGNADGLRTSGYEVESYYKPRLNTALEAVSDRLALVEAAFLLDKPETSLSIVEEGLKKFSGEDRKALSRTLSNIKIRLFQQSKQKLDDGTYTAEISLLDDAADADPDNPILSEEIANLLQSRIRPSRKAISILKRQIDAGVTTAETHRTLAIGYYLTGNTAEAIRNFDFAVGKSRTDSDSRNDLAMLLARENNPEIERALKLIEEAIAMAPNNPAYLDTYGQVLMIAGRYVEAVPKLEQSLENVVDLDDIEKLKSHINTRRQLSRAYREINMIDMANAQDGVINKLETVLKEKENENSPTPEGESSSVTGSRLDPVDV
ncbi:hypothetical protein SH449x_000135 [Pirellulaceae bacterium SH449]